MECVQAMPAVRPKKRKAETQDNERLSKRLSLLNLEANGQKLYVPVEQPTAPNHTKLPAQPQDDDVMHVDDTKYKVYIYNIDDELSDSESSDDSKLVFLPDIEKHLLDTRIPRSILANSEGELAGNNQLVLYNIPTSLTVPEAQDSVRKAIIETRARARAKHDQKQETDIPEAQTLPYTPIGRPSDTVQYPNGMIEGFVPDVPVVPESLDDDPDAMDLG